MAVGDDASSAGLPLVPGTGEEGQVKWGAREINRTRDFIAQVRALVPVGKAGFRAAAGITSSNADPAASAGENGDIHFKVL